MNKRSLLILFFAYLFLYYLNYLFPISFGDDYLYSFIWQGEAMTTPLNDSAVRVSSFRDILVSQWSHYITWGGRTVAHVLAQFFLWKGKWVFNFFNSLISLLLIVEIYCYIHQGSVSLNFSAEKLWCILLALWIFTPGFAPVFLWLTGSCNYLWTNVILIAFLIPYIQSYYDVFQKKESSNFLSFFMFVFGIVAGWTNENSVCWIILTLFFFIHNRNKISKAEFWMISGLMGLLIGYAFLVLAPGNVARLYSSKGERWINFDVIKTNVSMILTIGLFQFFLWFFNLHSFNILKRRQLHEEALKKDILFSKTLCMLSFAMTTIMFFSPGFPPRSGFSGTVLLIASAGILFRVQDEYGIELIQANAKRFLYYVGLIYFIFTAFFTTYLYYNVDLYFQKLLACVSQSRFYAQDEVLIVGSIRKLCNNENMLSGFHYPGFALSENETDWENVAFARYYGIKGISKRKWIR